jgi:hypothetical protein
MRPAWDFGRVLGLYVVFFFIIAQIGGLLIVSGGLVIAFAQG